MKTRLFLLAAATTIVFTACQNQNPESGYTQQQLDSIVQYKADSAANALKMINDSIIAASADSAAKADSIAAAANKGSKSTVTKKTTPPKKSTPPVVEPTKQAPVRTPAQIESDKKAARFGDAAAKARLEQDEVNKKKARFGDKDAKEKVQETDAQKKADRFNK